MAENGSAPPEATIILPPPAIKTIVDKTAAFIAPKPNAAQLEERFRQREQTDSRFSFLNPTNPYYAYYADRLAAFKAGEQPDAKGDDKGDPTKPGEDTVPEDDGRPKEPPALEFLVEDPPKISPVDLSVSSPLYHRSTAPTDSPGSAHRDILRLTALFSARSGAQFTRELAGRESRNYQFDFLRPSHSLFGYFNRSVPHLRPSRQSVETNFASIP